MASIVAPYLVLIFLSVIVVGPLGAITMWSILAIIWACRELWEKAFRVPPLR